VVVVVMMMMMMMMPQGFCCCFSTHEVDCGILSFEHTWDTQTSTTQHNLNFWVCLSQMGMIHVKIMCIISELCVYHFILNVIHFAKVYISQFHCLAVTHILLLWWAKSTKGSAKMDRQIGRCVNRQLTAGHNVLLTDFSC
jgi:hypothetical protein